MNLFLILAVLIFPLLSSTPTFDEDAMRDVVEATFPSNGGGMVCAGCTMIVKVIERIMAAERVPVAHFLAKICDIFPSKTARATCSNLVTIFGEVVVDLITQDVPPDDLCRKITLCKGYEHCTLFPESGEALNPVASKETRQKQMSWTELGEVLFKRDGPYGDDVHPPADEDYDGDYFSTDFVDRGTAWRGKDCNDDDPNMYPGRKVYIEGSDVDYNCNGISGRDAVSGKSWEEKLCGGSDRRGLLAIGDSACAHFRIPQELIAGTVSVEQLEYLAQIGLNEMDWPYLGMYNGYDTDTTGLCEGPVDSFYKHLRDVNRCNHRDYQSVCKNGEDSGSVFPNMKQLHRSRVVDHPAVLFINLIGNDVCTKTLAQQTRPEQFYLSIVAVLDSLNATLAPGSHVVMTSLAKGTLLYKWLHNQQHPLGVKYVDFYNYLNCLGASPCFGFLNSNDTIREITQVRADALSEVMRDLYISHNYFKNIKLHFMDFRDMTQDAVNWVLSEGGNPAVLAEPMDGFHPSQLAVAYFARLGVKWLTAEDPTIFGDSNPHNDFIERMFGDQGGY